MNSIFLAVIKSLILPPGVFIVLAIFVWVFLRKNIKIRNSIYIIMFAVFYMISTPFVARHLAGLVEPELIFEPEIASDAQVIVVLGCNLYVNAPEYEGSDDVSACTLVRLRYAAEVFSKTKLPIMTCGGKVFGKSEAEAKVMSRVLEERFNSKTKWQEINSVNTLQNAENAVTILNKEGINNIILVTHAIHMKRASYSFEKLNIKVYKAPTYFFSAENNNSLLLDFMPEINSLYVSRFAAYETIGLIWHWLKHL